MSISVPVAAGKAGTTGEVLNRVNALVPVLHSRAAATEKLRRMHPENLRDLTDASQTLLTADMQRYFRDINVLHQHAAIQPNTSNELYGRFVGGLAPGSDIL